MVIRDHPIVSLSNVTSSQPITGDVIWDETSASPFLAPGLTSASEPNVQHIVRCVMFRMRIICYILS